MPKTYYFVNTIDDSDFAVYRWGKDVFEKVIAPVFLDLGYETFEQDKLMHNNHYLSFSEIKQLAEANLAVFDLSINTPQIFYKLAICHMLQKPVIHIMRKGSGDFLRIDGMYIIEINIDTNEETEISKYKVKEQIHLLEEIQTPLPYISHLRQLLNVIEATDSNNKNRDVIFNLLDQFENIDKSLSYAREDLDILSGRLVYRKDEPTPSPFIEKRLAKVELINMRQKAGKIPHHKSMSR